MRERVTAQEVAEAVRRAGIVRVDHHDCAGCGYMTHYSVSSGQLYFHPGCHCGRWTPPELCPWDDASDWINMQTDPSWRAKLRRAFGLDAEPEPNEIDSPPTTDAKVEQK